MKSLIAKQRVAAMGILETRVGEENTETVFTGLKLQNWKLLINYTYSQRGRIWIVLNEEQIQLTPVFMSYQLIHCLCSSGQ